MSIKSIKKAVLLKKVIILMKNYYNIKQKLIKGEKD